MKIKIGTRKSKLAMAQTLLVVQAIQDKFSDIETELVPIVTKGDIALDKPLSSFGGKGVFISEIENALLCGEIDIAVHSAKDLPLNLQSELDIAAVLPRGDYRDVLITRSENSINNTDSFTVGTGSLRRRAAMKKLYSNVSFKEIRGNIDTRLSKLKSGEYDALILAMAGIRRLALDTSEEFKFLPFEYGQFLPAPCQGIIAAECKKESFAESVLKQINNNDAYLAFQTERYVLKLLGGSCTLPIGAYSKIDGENIFLSVTSDSEKIHSGSDLVKNRFALAERLVKNCV